KSDDFVKQKLNLYGLSGHALTEHTNYKLFEKFVRIKQANQLNAWKEADASTFAVWRDLGLGDINTWDDLMRAADTDAFKLYQRYADSFDNTAVIKAAFERKDVPVLTSDTSWTERIARMVNWKANEKSESYVMTTLGFDKLSPAELEANKNGKTFLVYWLLKFDNSLNVDRQNTKDILKKLMELEKMPPAEMTIMKNKDALDRDQQRTKILLKKLLGLENLSPAEMVANDKYQTYKYVYGLIKQNKIDDYTSTLLERLTPRL
ncbi:RxLR effector protein, partial [Phytophthora megakarya]